MLKRSWRRTNALKTNLDNSEKNVLATVQRAVQMELEAAKKDYREAYDSGDTDKVMDAQERLTQATLKADKVKNFKPTLYKKKNL